MLNAHHGIFAQGGRSPFHQFGTLLLHWDFLASTSLGTGKRVNTIDTSTGVTTFSRVYDFSGNERHGTVMDKASAPLVVAAGAGFNGLQYFKQIVELGVNVGTVIIKMNAGSWSSASTTFMMIGNFSSAVGAAGPGYLGLGNVTTSWSGEVIVWGTDGNTRDQQFYTNQSLSGNVTLGVTAVGASNDGLALVAVNGAQVPIVTLPTVYRVGYLDFQLGRRSNLAQYLTGTVEKVLIFSNRLTLAQHQQAAALL